MNGYVFIIGVCYSCDAPFTFNPNKVPSVVVDGVRQPICLLCVQRANPIRKKNGLAPIVPLPGAYEAEEAGQVL